MDASLYLGEINSSQAAAWREVATVPELVRDTAVELQNRWVWR
jgi:hypothetical protein